MTPRTPGFGGTPTARSTFLSYKLQCGVGTTLGSVEDMVGALESEPVQMRSARDTERLLQSDFCDRELIAEQLRQKSLLDDVYDAGNGKIWKVAQFSMFPSDCKGSFQHRTRSGDKLQEISEWLQEYKRLDCLPEMLAKGASPANPSFFLDLCAGPGTWSDWLLDEIDFIDQTRLDGDAHSLSPDISPQTATEEDRSTRLAAGRLSGPSCYGFGISLNISDLTAMRDTKFWHIAKEVTERPNYESITALNNSGNLYCSKNLKLMKQKIELRVAEIREQCAALLPQADSAPASKQSLSFRDQRSPSRSSRPRRSGDKGVIKLIVADGGITIPKKSATGQHLDNYQELLTGRLLLSEFLIAFQLLQQGGTFICTVFDSFTAFTASLLYLCTALFEEVYMVKPSRNRWTNSERQLVALKFRRFRSVNLGALVAASTEAGGKPHSLPSPAFAPAAPRPEMSSSSLSSSVSLAKRAPVMFPRVSRVYSATVSKLTQVHEALSEAATPTDYYTVLPETLLRRSFLKGDALFVESYRRMCVELCRLQCISLQQTYAKFLELQRNPGQLQELRQRQRTLERCMNALKGSAAIASISTMGRPPSCDASQYAGDTPSPYGGDRTRRTLDFSALSPGTHFNGKYACATERGPHSPGAEDRSGGSSVARTLGSAFSPASSGEDDHGGRLRNAAEEAREKEMEADWWRVGERRRQRGKATEALGNKTVPEPEVQHQTQATVGKNPTADLASSSCSWVSGGASALSWRRQDEARHDPGSLPSGDVEPSTRQNADQADPRQTAPCRSSAPPSSTALGVPISNADFWCGLLRSPDRMPTGESSKHRPTPVSAREAAEERAAKAEGESARQMEEAEAEVEAADSAGKTGDGATKRGEAEKAEEITNGIDAEVISLIQAPEVDLAEEALQDEALCSQSRSILLSQAMGEDDLVAPLSQPHRQTGISVSAEDTNDARVPSRTRTTPSTFVLAALSGEQRETREAAERESGGVLNGTGSPGERGAESREGSSSEEAEEENAAHTAVSLIESVLDCDLGELNAKGEALATRVMHTVSARLTCFNSMAEPPYSTVEGDRWKQPETFSAQLPFPSMSPGLAAPTGPEPPVSSAVSAPLLASPPGVARRAASREEGKPKGTAGTANTEGEKARKLVDAEAGQRAPTMSLPETPGRRIDTHVTASAQAPEESDRKTDGAPLRSGDVSGEKDPGDVVCVLAPPMPKAALSSQPNGRGRTGRSPALENSVRRRITNKVLRTLNAHLHGQGGPSGSCLVGLADTNEKATPTEALSRAGKQTQSPPKRESLTPEEVASFLHGTVGRAERCEGGNAHERQRAPLSWKHATVEEDGISTVSTLPTETIDIAVGIHVDESP
ncbi:FtsJ methyltransferase domain-containing protein 2, related [Neospora caninum Liverpool]|uniref:Cap-specific mRNA (nucleoside-2'-O-)-methyltransferase 1 n=1 Tax=Neospora caninum (strain Liverpool) TaxID=572307 RepID=F0VP95_NEOCL|nr:FtsJ methyltransferase domain-containing protein 2, related [Neospora caninum Liverpool]CBZ55541.1 FtsJ methyltransferase domain-containing protein 2, related [Neospora caninum Liverpool]CEL70281.1 TPA: FtsJ methyltransferase domain-containing protein 2, related [Neospora caninum Liverpool]|eukprot:XP_003885569.1 FtsJ methyltransferase domain-containing protein 2, related [Neospora caninum Liverpool]